MQQKWYGLGTPKRGSLIQVMVDSKDADTGQPFNDVAVSQMAMTMFIAGNDNNGATISFLLYLLAKEDPRHQDMCAEECAKVDIENVEGLDSLMAALPYTCACLDEALRLFPPAFVTQRMALQDVQVGSRLVRKGTNVVFNIAAMHLNPEYFPDPEEFKPERFVPGTPEFEDKRAEAFMPWGIAREGTEVVCSA